MNKTYELDFSANLENSSKNSDFEKGVDNVAFDSTNSVKLQKFSEVSNENDEKEQLSKEMEDQDEHLQLMENEFDAEDPRGLWYKMMHSIENKLVSCRSDVCKKIVKIIVVIIICLGLLAYVIGCIIHFAKYGSTEDFNREASIRVFWISALVVFLLTVHYIRVCLQKFDLSFTLKCSKFKERLSHHCPTLWSILPIVIMSVILIALIVWVGISRPTNLISLLGMFVLLFISFLLSAHHSRINWQPVIGGLMIQFIFAAIVLKTTVGYVVFEFLGNETTHFLNHVNHGSEFLFGANFRDHFFAFSILPVIVYFSSVITVLFHLGILQKIIGKVGYVMEFIMGTTAAESLVASANIFIGQTEAPLMIRPFIGRMTNSEIHSVMTSGFATIAGGVLAAYIGMGVPAKHLLTASIMSAPAALAVSKLMYPETKKTRTSAERLTKVKVTQYSNIIDAASSGAMNSLAIVGAIAVNLIAFISILAFINATLTWLGYRVGLQFPLTFEYIMSYVFWPIAFVMGVPAVDCRQVAELIGIKTFLNEFVAYVRFSTIKSNAKIYNSLNATEHQWVGSNLLLPNHNKTLIGGMMFDNRSYMISTYALCGFSNLGSIGIMIGALAIMAPRKQSDIVRCSLTAMLAGNIACFLTACIASLFYEDEILV